MASINFNIPQPCIQSQGVPNFNQHKQPFSLYPLLKFAFFGALMAGFQGVTASLSNHTFSTNSTSLSANGSASDIQNDLLSGTFKITALFENASILKEFVDQRNLDDIKQTFCPFAEIPSCHDIIDKTATSIHKYSLINNSLESYDIEKYLKLSESEINRVINKEKCIEIVAGVNGLNNKINSLSVDEKVKVLSTELNWLFHEVNSFNLNATNEIKEVAKRIVNLKSRINVLETEKARYLAKFHLEEDKAASWRDKSNNYISKMEINILKMETLMKKRQDLIQQKEELDSDTTINQTERNKILEIKIKELSPIVAEIKKLSKQLNEREEKEAAIISNFNELKKNMNQLVAKGKEKRLEQTKIAKEVIETHATVGELFNSKQKALDEIECLLAITSKTLTEAMTSNSTVIIG